MILDAHTKISIILKQAPQSLDAIISLSPRFEKLRIPLLRKVMAPRTDLAMAAKIGGCTVADFLRVLKPFGFEVDNRMPDSDTTVMESKPAFLLNIAKEAITTLDVRPMLAQGKDPLQLILENIKNLPVGNVLQIINTFEPLPLISLLKKRGFLSFTEVKDVDEVHTYFFAPGNLLEEEKTFEINESADFKLLIQKYEGRMHTINVQQLEMPGPMHAILNAIETLPDGFALYVYHKRVPVYLLPLLREKGFDYRINQLSENTVHLLLFRNTEEV